MKRTVIAYDDDQALGKQLESIFYALRPDFNLIAVYKDTTELSEHLEMYNPDIILMDIQMREDNDGLVALYKIKHVRPETKVLMLTMFDADEKVFHSICLGADGYMLKSDFAIFQLPHEAIRKSLKIIFEGGAYLTPSVAKRILKLFMDKSLAEKVQKVKDKFKGIFQRETNTSKRKDSELTRMQELVLQKIVDGKSTSEIARELKLSENTINTHIKAIYAILEVHSRARAIRKAMERNGAY